MKAKLLPAALLCCIVCTQGWTEDLSYIDDDELALELVARQTDLDRTTSRLKEIQQALLAQKNEVFNLKKELEHIDSNLVQRTSMLYRLSKNGKSVQYLFSSNSATSFIKRMQTLKKLVTSQMDKKRDVSLQMARANDQIHRLKDELHSAEQLTEQLFAVVDNLQKEQQRRTSKDGNLVLTNPN